MYNFFFSACPLGAFERVNESTLAKTANGNVNVPSWIIQYLAEKQAKDGKDP